MKHEFRALNGTPFTLERAPADDKPAVFFLSVHKAGSTLLQRLVRDLCEASERPLVELEPDLFREGIVLSDCPLELIMWLEETGYVFSGFRSPWILHFVRQYREGRKLLLIRDPRDIAVSFYFSMAKSHTLPAKGEARAAILSRREQTAGLTPSQYVLEGRANDVLRNIMQFSRHVDLYGNFNVVRYEDIIFDKMTLSQTIVDLMEADVPASQMRLITARHDVRPAQERPDAHIRQVTPGNYKVHLSDEAQSYLWQHFQPIFTRFNYN